MHSSPHRDMPCSTTSFSPDLHVRPFSVSPVLPSHVNHFSSPSPAPIASCRWPGQPLDGYRAFSLASSSACPSSVFSPHSKAEGPQPLRWVLVAILQKSKLRHVKPQNRVSQVMQPPPSADRAEGVRTQHVTQAPCPSQRPLAVAPRAESTLPACEAPARPWACGPHEPLCSPVPPPSFSVAALLCSCLRSSQQGQPALSLENWGGVASNCGLLVCTLGEGHS